VVTKVKRGTDTAATREADRGVDIELGERLKRLRKRAGLTQAQVAARVEIDEKSLSRLEAGKLRPSLDTLDRLRDALSGTWGDLFAFRDVDVETSLRLKLVRHIMDAAPDELLAISEMLKQRN
jgi:transcriptional regulator with XRE-family HTH domain